MTLLFRRKDIYLICLRAAATGGVQTALALSTSWLTVAIGIFLPVGWGFQKMVLSLQSRLYGLYVAT